jgi:hypothetical protein
LEEIAYKAPEIDGILLELSRRQIDTRSLLPADPTGSEHDDRRNLEGRGHHKTTAITTSN